MLAVQADNENSNILVDMIVLIVALLLISSN